MEPPVPDPQSVKDLLAASHDAMLQKVAAAADVVDAEFAFQSLVTSSLLRMNKGFRESEHGDIPALVELAAFHLYPRFGQKSDRDPAKVQAVIEALTELNGLRGLHTAFSVETEGPAKDVR